ncbi:MazG nucleotide pyrophosphohydrolase domain-containing protein [Planococcus sp. 1R117A]|uniref:MazG nucleotide pyrophosphohydrolase domain-containing protein n=1 Tax=Planococcus sp. 1R117A TaxID=3447020 RepID=UPI003EDC2E18
MKDMQEFAKQYQKEMGWSIEAGNYEENRASLLNNYMLLTTEVAEVAEELRKAFNLTHKHVQNGLEEKAAFELASEAVKEDVGKELADCLAYIMKFANFFDINLEESFYRKMEEVKNRQNKDAIAKK